MEEVNRNIYLEIDRPAVDLPVAEAGGVGAAAAAEFFGHFGLGRRLTALFGFLQGALGSRGKRFPGSFLFRGGFRIVVICVLHFGLRRVDY